MIFRDGVSSNLQGSEFVDGTEAMLLVEQRREINRVNDTPMTFYLNIVETREAPGSHKNNSFFFVVVYLSYRGNPINQKKKKNKKNRLLKYIKNEVANGNR